MQKILIMMIKFYQKAISGYLKSECKYYPSCSEYAALSIKKYGSIIGIIKTVSRLIRCNPLSTGGIDFP